MHCLISLGTGQNIDKIINDEYQENIITNLIPLYWAKAQILF